MRRYKAQCLLPAEPEAWPRYVRTTVAINEAARKLCEHNLSQRLANVEAERDNLT